MNNNKILIFIIMLCRIKLNYEKIISNFNECSAFYEFLTFLSIFTDILFAYQV